MDQSDLSKEIEMEQNFPTRAQMTKINQNKKE